MTGVRYKIPMLSAKAILAYAKPVGEDIYSFNLNKADWLKEGMGIDTTKDPLDELKEFEG